MQRPNFELETSSKFVEADLETSGESLVFVEVDREQKSLRVVAASADFRTRREIGALPAQSLGVGTIAASRRRRTVYAAGRGRIWAFPLEGGAPSVLLELPTLSPWSEEEARHAFDTVSDVNWARRGMPLCTWFFELDQSESRLWVHCMQDGSFAHLLEIDLERGAIESAIALPAWSAGIAVDLASGKVVLPGAARGPVVLDLTGKPLAQLRTGCAFLESSIRPVDSSVVLAQGSTRDGLHLWRGEGRDLETLAEEGAAPRCGPDGSIFYMRTSADLWRWSEGNAPELVARISEGPSSLVRSEGLRYRPLVSRDGRYLLAHLVVEVDGVQWSTAVTVDLAASRLSRAPGFYGNAIAWF